MEIKRVLNGEESILEFCYSRNPDLFGIWQLTEHIWMIFSPSVSVFESIFESILKVFEFFASVTLKKLMLLNLFLLEWDLFF